MSLLGNMENPDELGNPETIRKYVSREEREIQAVENYPYREWNSDLVTMLSTNRECRCAAGNLRDEYNPLPDLSRWFYQSFRTAGTVFQVIDQKTKSVLVPYGRGKELIEALGERHTLGGEIALLKEAQQYSVNLFENMFDRLDGEHALYSLGGTGVVALKGECYDPWAGVMITPQE